MNSLRDWLRPLLPTRQSGRDTRSKTAPRVSQETAPTTGVAFELTRKPIKRIYLRIKAPDGKITVSAPYSVSLNHIDSLLHERQDWIRQQQTRIRQTTASAPTEPLGHGAPIQCLGQHLALHITAGARSNRAEPDAGILRLHRREASPTPTQIKLGLNQHLREILQQTLDERVPYWARHIGVDPSFIGIKRMKTRWGSCNVRDRRIWLNLELARMPVECIDLVLVHELVHLHERRHNARFYAFMDHYLPDWRKWQAELLRYGMAGL
jgi:predicted metal-dependent hydrolase